MEKSKRRKPIKLRIKKDIPDLTEDNIDSVFNDNFEKIDLDNVDYNTYLNNKELLARSTVLYHLLLYFLKEFPILYLRQVGS